MDYRVRVETKKTIYTLDLLGDGYDDEVVPVEMMAQAIAEAAREHRPKAHVWVERKNVSWEVVPG